MVKDPDIINPEPLTNPKIRVPSDDKQRFDTIPRSPHPRFPPFLRISDAPFPSLPPETRPRYQLNLRERVNE